MSMGCLNDFFYDPQCRHKICILKAYFGNMLRVLSLRVLYLQDRSLAFHELCALYASTGIPLGYLSNIIHLFAYLRVLSMLISPFWYEETSRS